ncbi:MAG: hypothetical protein M1832_001532 [Thelocarpon impressellum]|nr:MAG: hypothetical protein M1832_001532 [Thelocarpon impressellum]
MSLTQESHDSLPYIDPDLTPSEREHAVQVIAKEIACDHHSALHPSLPSFPEIQFSDILEAELARKATNLPVENGVDLSRYEALEPPPATDPTSDEDRPQVLEAWRSTLQKAYASSTYLQTRLTNLSLLEQFGRNAWLMGNAALEDVLRGLEAELVDLKGRTEEVNKARKSTQEGARGELEVLGEAWRGGVGRVIEVEVAAEGVRREILERRREAAQRLE